MTDIQSPVAANIEDTTDDEFVIGTEQGSGTGAKYPFAQWSGSELIVQNVKGQWQPIKIPGGGQRATEGFLLRRPESEDEYSDLDQACKDAGYEALYVKHSAGVSPHWYTPKLGMLVLTLALPNGGGGDSDREKLHKDPTFQIVRQGISHGWYPVRERAEGDDERKVQFNDSTRVQTKSFRRWLALIPDLMAVGYKKPIMLTFKKTITEDVDKAFARHLEIQKLMIAAGTKSRAFLSTVHAAMVEGGMEKPRNVPFFASVLTLTEGGMQTKGKIAGKTRDVLVCKLDEPEEITEEWLETQVADAEQRWFCQEWLDIAIAWSVEDTMSMIKLTDDEYLELEEIKAARKNAATVANVAARAA